MFYFIKSCIALFLFMWTLVSKIVKGKLVRSEEKLFLKFQNNSKKSINILVFRLKRNWMWKKYKTRGVWPKVSSTTWDWSSTVILLKIFCTWLGPRQRRSYNFLLVHASVCLCGRSSVRMYPTFPGWALSAILHSNRNLEAKKKWQKRIFQINFCLP